MRELTQVLVTLWTKDDPLFIHERYRIQLNFIFLVYLDPEPELVRSSWEVSVIG